MLDSLSVVLLLGSGTITGVFVAVWVSVAPALFAMPRGAYVEAHKLLGKGYHPLMPLLVNATMLSGIALAFLAEPLPARVLFAVAAVLLVGVQAVSHLGNVPINRSLYRDDALTAADWSDPRPPWRAWHRIRTALAIATLVANSVAVVVAT